MHSSSRLCALAAAIVAAGVAMPAMAANYATVVSSTPITQQVPVPRQSCVQGEQYVQQAPTGAGAIVGAIAGGVIGNAVGGGAGRAAATGLGVVAGSLVGNQVEANSNPVTAVPVQRCQTFTGYESQVVGYDVVYDYAGQRYRTRLAQDPGRQFAVDVRPSDMAAPAPAPQGYYAPPAAYPAPYPAPYPAYPSYSPYYYAPGPVVYGGPVVGIGFGYYGGWRGGRWR